MSLCSDVFKNTTKSPFFIITIIKSKKSDVPMPVQTVRIKYEFKFYMCNRWFIYVIFTTRGKEYKPKKKNSQKYITWKLFFSLFFYRKIVLDIWYFSCLVYVCILYTQAKQLENTKVKWIKFNTLLFYFRVLKNCNNVVFPVSHLLFDIYYGHVEHKLLQYFKA